MYSLRYTAPALAGCMTLATLAAPVPAAAQLHVQVGVAVPQFHVEVGAPLVYVEPGVWVLPDSQEEVFYNDGWYWARNDGHWHRSRGRHSGWVAVDEGYVPRPLMRMAPGRYRSYHAPARARMMAPRGWEVRRENRHVPVYVPAPMHRGEGHPGTMSGRDDRRMYQGATPTPVLIPVPMHHGGRKGKFKDKGHDNGRGHGRGSLVFPVARTVAPA